MTKPHEWSAVIDTDYVECPMLAIQRAIVAEAPTKAVEDDDSFFGPDPPSQCAAHAAGWRVGVI